MSDEYKWGDDPVAAIQKAAGSSLAVQIEDDIVAGYLILLRKEIESNSELSELIAKGNSENVVKTALTSACKLVKPGTDYLLDRVISMLLEELEQHRQAKPSLYLISQKTGRAIIPIEAKDVYTPPDYIGLDGKIHKSNPIVHPKLSSSLAIASYEAAKQELVLTKITPKTHMAHTHLSTPEQIVQKARQKLAGLPPCENGEWKDVEFGKEHVAGMEQSVNPSFHRVELFSSILARKVFELCGKGGQYNFGSIRSCRNAKLRWYVIPVEFKRMDITGI